MHLPTLRFFEVDLCVSGSVLGTTTKILFEMVPSRKPTYPHLGKRTIIFKQTLDGEYLSSQQGMCFPVYKQANVEVQAKKVL